MSTPTLSSTSAHSAAAGLTAAELARSTKHAAWLAAASAILAAVLALVGTFWSAHRSSTASERAAATAADAAVKAVSVQLSGETDRSRAEFLRGQRRDLYSTIIVHETEIREAFKLMSLKGEANQEWIWKYEDKRQKSFDAFCQAARKDMGAE